MDSGICPVLLYKWPMGIHPHFISVAERPSRMAADLEQLVLSLTLGGLETQKKKCKSQLPAILVAEFTECMLLFSMKTWNLYHWCASFAKSSSYRLIEALLFFTDVRCQRPFADTCVNIFSLKSILLVEEHWRKIWVKRPPCFFPILIFTLLFFCRPNILNFFFLKIVSRYFS